MPTKISEIVAQYGGNPPRSVYDFPENEKRQYMEEHPVCQRCKKYKSKECAHIRSGDPNGPRYYGGCNYDTIIGKCNMLALCKICHKTIDNPDNYYEIRELRDMKKNK